MADIGQSAWSETDANNNQAAPDGFPEGMAPSGVNDAARAMMGAVKRFWGRVNGTKTTAGTADAQTVTYDVAPTGYVAGERLLLRPTLTTATASPTINVNGLGAKTLKDSTGAALVFGGALAAGTQAELMYDGTDMRILSLPWKTGSWLPALSSGGGSISYALRDAYYLRSGPVVFFHGVVRCSSISGVSGAVSVTGFPYAAAVTSYGISCHAASFGYNAYSGTGIQVLAQIGSGSTAMLMQVVESNGTVSIFSVGMQNGTEIQFHGHYFTNAAY